jgi:hypothetical protein
MPQCLEPGCLRLVKGARCATHGGGAEAGRQWYRGDWPAFARAVLDAWTSERGPLCMGWQRDPHMVTRRDLCLDHLEARSFSRDPGDYQALCRSCNGAKGDRDAVERPVV